MKEDIMSTNFKQIYNPTKSIFFMSKPWDILEKELYQQQIKKIVIKHTYNFDLVCSLNYFLEYYKKGSPTIVFKLKDWNECLENRSYQQFSNDMEFYVETAEQAKSFLEKVKELKLKNKITIFVKNRSLVPLRNKCLGIIDNHNIGTVVVPPPLLKKKTNYTEYVLFTAHHG